MKKAILFVVSAFLFVLPVQGQIITTIAGGGTSGLGDGGPAVGCELNFPYSTAVDAAGNIYIADGSNNRVRKINRVSGVITTIAGTGIAGYNGDAIAATAAQLATPSCIVIDATGDILISDNGNHRIRKINSTGIISTIAGNGAFGFAGDNGPATAAQLYSPHGIAVDGIGNLYICDVLNNRIRKVNVTGVITTIVGTGASGYTGDGGPATVATMQKAFFMAFDTHGSFYFTDFNNNCVRKVDNAGIITTIAGVGTLGYNGDNMAATSAKLNRPVGIAINANGEVFIADGYNSRIRKVSSMGEITTVAGTGVSGYSGDNGPATNAELNDASGIAIDNSGNLYIADFGNDLIRYIKNTVGVRPANTQLNNLDVFPNPSFTGDFSLKLNTATQISDFEVFITSLTGQTIATFTGLPNKVIPLSLDLPSGVYILSAIAEHSVIQRKIIVDR